MVVPVSVTLDEGRGHACRRGHHGANRPLIRHDGLPCRGMRPHAACLSDVGLDLERCGGGLVSNRFQEATPPYAPAPPAFCQKGLLSIHPSRRLSCPIYSTACRPLSSTSLSCSRPSLSSPIRKSRLARLDPHLKAVARVACIDSRNHQQPSKLASHPPPPSVKTPPYTAHSSRARPELPESR